MKMLIDPTLLDGGVKFVEIDPSSWLVTIDGDTRTISKDERGFIAHIGCMDRHWCFDRAMKACVEDARHHAAEHARALALQAERDRQLSRLSPEQFDYVLAAREQELAGLSVNSPGRRDMLREDIRLMKEARP